MIKRNNFSYTLRRQFLIRILALLIITATVSGFVQYALVKDNIESETENMASLIAQSLNNDIQETILASRAIEQQIDRKLISQSAHIADMLPDKPVDEISTGELLEIKSRLGLAGITLLTEKNEDVQAIVSTEPQDIGFSLKAIGFLEAALTLMRDGKAEIPGATYVDNGIVVLPIAQSASHADEPVFYKYAYFHPAGTEFVVSAYVEAGEVNQFTEQTGADAWIEKMIEQNRNIVEISILTPAVFADPTLEDQIYPPMKKVVNGQFTHQTEEDVQVLKQLAEKPETVTRIQKIADQRLYKLFLPIRDQQVLYVALDYRRISEPLTRLSVILIVSGFFSLITLFVLTANFFNRIYRNIQSISKQIHSLEAKDFTARSHLKGRGELINLSTSTNMMADTLNHVLKGTNEQAANIKHLSLVLEEESKHSVERVYGLSMEKTTRSRDAAEELYHFLDEVEQLLDKDEFTGDRERILSRIETLRQLIRSETGNTTEITITLSDLMKSLHLQSIKLAGISNLLHQEISQFKLEK